MDRNFVIKLTELKGFLLNCARIPVCDAQEVTQPTKHMSINSRFVMEGCPGKVPADWRWKSSEIHVKLCEGNGSVTLIETINIHRNFPGVGIGSVNEL